jgi:PAS domain-containing protein
MRTRTFPSESGLARAKRLRAVAFGTFAALAVQMVALMAIDPPHWSRRATALAIVAVLIGLVDLINRRGRTGVASWVFVLGLIAMATQRAWGAGGINSAAMAEYAIFILMGGVLLGQLGGFVSAAACTVGASILVAGQLLGRLPKYTPTPPLGMLVFLLMVLCLGLVLQAMVGDTFRSTLKRQEDEIERRSQVQLRLDLAMRAATISVWELDRAQGRLLADARLGELYDVPVSPDGIVALDDLMSRIHPDDVASVLARREAMSRPGATIQHEHRVVRPGGTIRYVRGASVNIAGDEGQTGRRSAMARLGHRQTRRAKATRRIRTRHRC